METKICRICGKLSENYVHIFKREGLKNKIETCLPIIVSPHCLLPDTICCECSENVDNFYSFIKNCLQNIIILEAQYDIHESCLKTKRKHEKSCMTETSTFTKYDKNIQTDEDFSDIIFLKEKSFSFTQKLAEVERILTNNDIDFEKFNPISSLSTINCKNTINLVDYDIDTDDNSDVDESQSKHDKGKVELPLVSKRNRNFVYNNSYYLDNFEESNLINEITSRKNLKRKAVQQNVIYNSRTKIFKMDSSCSNRRKNRQPKKLETNSLIRDYDSLNEYLKLFNDSSKWNAINRQHNLQSGFSYFQKSCENQDFDNKSMDNNKFNKIEKEVEVLPQACLLCDAQLNNASLLAAHVLDVHGIDMAQVISSEPIMEKKNNHKKLPNLVKIADLKSRNDKDNHQENLRLNEEQAVADDDEPPRLQPSIVCPICPLVFTCRPDLFNHLRGKHVKESALLCGLCLNLSTSYSNLSSHTELCRKNYTLNGKFVCKICSYNDDNQRHMENHVLVHDFLITYCKQQLKIFDPFDYVELNPNIDLNTIATKLQCNECSGDDNNGEFHTFKEFSEHRRSKHQIFHCDLCNKFYGRNSHLWKHVNRLHKGHPSITCQLCYKTSASKYHLAQHFSKLHGSKVISSSNSISTNGFSKDDEFLNQKFDGFDFQSVRQSFMKQELMQQQQQKEREQQQKDQQPKRGQNKQKLTESNYYNNSNLKENLPKELDTSSDLYTNIITNYTPPSEHKSEGEFKCPKCFRGFHMKLLLKKHKKNCRPRLQKDLLTRCKTCMRIFKDRQSLTKHLINYHSEYTCEICNEKVSSKCEIVTHIRFKHPNCHLYCTRCENILRSTNDLLLHQQDHFNSFVCQFCGDMLQTKIKLKMHILSLHRKILSLSCGICLKLFETQHILRDHVRLVHKDHLKPFVSCTVCGKNYGSKWKTYDHLNKSHGRIFKACKLCLEIFDNEDQLQKHYDSKHLNANNKLINNLANESIVATPKKENDSDYYDEEKNFLLFDLSNDCFDTTIDCADGNKMSLLEKQLSRTSSSGNNKVSVTNNSDSNNQTPKSTVSGAQNGSNGPSKRTVYVNSNVPSLCEICKKTWPAKKHLWQHYIRCHKSVAATVCGICLQTNETYETLQKHLQETHPSLLYGQGFGSNFICKICGRYHNANSKLKLHMAIHENFDWSILDSNNATNTTAATTTNNVKDIDDKPVKSSPNKKQSNAIVPNVNNGYVNNNGEDLYDDVINYESLIEQVECTSDSDINDSDVENTKKPSSSEDDDDDDNDDSGDESNLSDMETEMLQNMIREKKEMKKLNDTIDDNDNNDDNDEDDEDEEEDDEDEEEEEEEDEENDEDDEEVEEEDDATKRGEKVEELSKRRINSNLTSVVKKEYEITKQEVEDLIKENVENEDFSRESKDFSRRNEDYNRGNEDYNRGNEAYNRGNEAYNRGNEDYNRENEAYSKGNEDYNRRNEDCYSRGNEDCKREQEDFKTEEEDDENFNRNDDDINEEDDDFNDDDRLIKKEINNIKIVEGFTIKVEDDLTSPKQEEIMIAENDKLDYTSSDDNSDQGDDEEEDEEDDGDDADDDDDEPEDEEEEEDSNSNSTYNSEIESSTTTTSTTTGQQKSDDDNNDRNSNTNTNDSMGNNNNKARELDSAIRSISYDDDEDEEVVRIDITEEDEDDEDCDDDDDDGVPIILRDFVDLQNQNLNQHEIQTAVDSIL